MNQKGMVPAWQMTPRQYHRARLLRIAKEYGLSMAEVKADYDTDQQRREDNNDWIEAVRAAARAGNQLSRQTLDKLFELGGGREDWNPLTQLLHDIPNVKVPNGYVTPAARRISVRPA